MCDVCGGRVIINIKNWEEYEFIFCENNHALIRYPTLWPGTDHVYFIVRRK